MLSWNDDDNDAFSKRSTLTKAGSLQRPGNSFEAQRGPSSRKSVDVPASPGSRKSLETTTSPSGSLNKAHSLLRSHGVAAEGTIGSEGWWHHMDHSQMNEPPMDDSMKVDGKAAGFVPQYGVTGQSRSLWAGEEAAVKASGDNAPADSAAAAPVPPPAAVPQQAAASPVAVPAPPARAAAPAASSPGAESSPSVQNAASTGWWALMDNGILNQPAETTLLAAGEVRKGERVMGGGFTPQFAVAGGSHYGSIFGSEVQQTQAAVASIPPLEQQQAARENPFLGQERGDSGVAPADEGWSNFTAAS